MSTIYFFCWFLVMAKNGMARDISGVLVRLLMVHIYMVVTSKHRRMKLREYYGSALKEILEPI